MKISRNQTAVYWAPTGKDGYGAATFAAPVELSVRWEDKGELFLNPQGKEELSKSVVYPESTVLLDGRMWLGAVDSLPSDDGPFGVASRQIKSVYSCPNIRGDFSFLKVWLV